MEGRIKYTRRLSLLEGRSRTISRGIFPLVFLLVIALVEISGVKCIEIDTISDSGSGFFPQRQWQQYRHSHQREHHGSLHAPAYGYHRPDNQVSDKKIKHAGNIFKKEEWLKFGQEGLPQENMYLKSTSKSNLRHEKHAEMQEWRKANKGRHRDLNEDNEEKDNDGEYDADDNNNKNANDDDDQNDNAADGDGYDYGDADAEEANDDDDDADDKVFRADSQCEKYLMSFIQGYSDAKDNCDGIQNAYVAAYCRTEGKASSSYSSYSSYEEGDDDHDDYFKNYNSFSCCQSLKSHYDTYCQESEIITNMHLLLIACVLLLCEISKSLIKGHKLHFLPEAGGCILVGTLVGAIAHLLPDADLDDLIFDEELFLLVLLPPIIFEAALSVNKKEFRRRRLAILMFAVFGTILSTFMSGYMIHYTSKWIKSATSIPMLDSLIFGALISSIDPVAILSVLSSLKLTEEDTVFIMVFGESLLNDGVSITLFNSLVRHHEVEDTDTVDYDEILGAVADFLIIGFGSIAIGIICGFLALIYFWLLRKKLNAPMEVASFFLWAGIPYYICDEAKLSGIVAIVTVGFFMDIYIASPKQEEQLMVAPTPMMRGSGPVGGGNGIGVGDGGIMTPFASPSSPYQVNTHYIELGNSIPCHADTTYDMCGNPQTENSPSGKSIYSLRSLRSLKSLRTLNMRQLLLREEKFRLSQEADRHVRFVAHLLSQLSENCIFVYLGLFLFSKTYVWDLSLIGLSILACLLSRAIMVVVICGLVWYINIFRQRCGCYKPMHDSFDTNTNTPQVSRTAAALQDRRIQLVLVLSGLRGAVSLALVESLPIYNEVTGEGSIYKREMKAMTSASIMFTVFFLGGSAYYILRRLDIQSIDKELAAGSSMDVSSNKPGMSCSDSIAKSKSSVSGTRSLSRQPEHGHASGGGANKPVRPCPESPVARDRKVAPILIPSSKSLL